MHDRSLGPFKGGIRFYPGVDRAYLRELAASMSWKTALNDLPLGGAKGRVNCDPTRLGQRDLREITRRYADRIGDLIGPELDIPAPDMGTDEATMAWMYDAYGLKYGDRPGLVTELAAQRHGLDLQGARIAVREAAGGAEAINTAIGLPACRDRRGPAGTLDSHRSQHEEADTWHRKDFTRARTP